MKRWAGHVGRMADRRHAYRKCERNRPLGEHRGRWENNIKTALKEII